MEPPGRLTPSVPDVRRAELHLVTLKEFDKLLLEAAAGMVFGQVCPT